jgi:hypothetical protein
MKEVPNPVNIKLRADLPKYPFRAASENFR